MADWRNRIIERRVMKVSELRGNRFNPRLHPDIQKQRLKATLDKFGIVGELIAFLDDQNPDPVTGKGAITLFDGHARQNLDPNQEWPVVITDLTSQEAYELSLYFDPISALARPDPSQQMALMQDLQGVDGVLGEFLDELAKESGFKRGQNGNEAGTDTEPQIDKAAELAEKWGTRVGQVWGLGPHRLICGDCTDRAVVEAVMQGEKAHLFLTDPPYGVSYADKNEYLNTVAFGNRIQTPIENDHLSIEETAEKVWKPAFKNAHDSCNSQASFYLFMPQGGDQMMMMMMMMMSEHWIPRHELIWVKNNHVLGRADYAYKHEPILYGWKREGTHKYYGGFQTSILEYDKPLKSDLHPTTKPLPLIEHLIPNNTQIGEIVLDLFLGSGTTLIACHNLNRVCRAVELDPGYVAVCLERFFTHTSITPILLSE